MGPMQIHREYFHDAAQFDKSLGNDYSKVIDLSFAKKVVSAYLRRYAPNSVANNDFKTMAMIHNAGPKGYKNPNAIEYWNKIRNHLTRR